MNCRIQSKGCVVNIPQMGVAYVHAHTPCVQSIREDGFLLRMRQIKKYWKEKYNVRIVSPRINGGYKDYKFIFEDEGAFVMFMLEWS
jgi:hypothetical protein